MKVLKLIQSAYAWFNKICEFLTPAGDLFIRGVIAYHFLPAGWLKLQSWSSTLLLFEHEYAVPFLSPVFAAYMGTFVEITMPILLLIGFGGRIPALILFKFNVLAVYAYQHFLFGPSGAEGLEDHFYWGVLIMVTLFHGTGKLSLDYLLSRRPASEF
jgi:putative oxidoreductase